MQEIQTENYPVKIPESLLSKLLQTIKVNDWSGFILFYTDETGEVKISERGLSPMNRRGILNAAKKLYEKEEKSISFENF